MTLSQCKSIIDNDFLGEHRKDGSQTDYFDYKEEIQSHVWDLQAKAFEKMHAEQAYIAELKGN